MEKITERKTIQAVRETIAQWRKEELSVGFVPTMGYLHQGHRSLIERAAAENDRVVVSVFVNPMQFGPKEDLATYPRDEQRDNAVCLAAGADIIFRPTAEEMYPPGFCSFVDMSAMTATLCGASRPGHFRGVCTVVAKLFHIVKPDRAYFGQKDAQQLAVIRRMTADLNLDIQIIGCPIVREADGLAMSSRNTYLNPQERNAALCLSRALAAAKQHIEAGEKQTSKILSSVRGIIEAEPLARVDYLELVDAATLLPLEKIDRPTLCAAAVWIGRTRLIDNLMIEEFEG